MCLFLLLICRVHINFATIISQSSVGLSQRNTNALSDKTDTFFPRPPQFRKWHTFARLKAIPNSDFMKFIVFNFSIFAFVQNIRDHTVVVVHCLRTAGSRFSILSHSHFIFPHSHAWFRVPCMNSIQRKINISHRSREILIHQFYYLLPYFFPIKFIVNPINSDALAHYLKWLRNETNTMEFPKRLRTSEKCACNAWN